MLWTNKTRDHRHVSLPRTLLLITSVLFAIPAVAQQSCERLTGVKLADATVTSAVSVPAGPFTVPGAADRRQVDLPAFCRVAGVANPTPDSEIRFEVWLPISGWNRRFGQVGNGGWAGAVPIGGLAVLLERGYAAAGTDDGHENKHPGVDASWAIGHPEKLIDFGYRAVHETSIQAKAIIKAFYGKVQHHAYFNGCSDGGREALMEAQRFPEDFDGIIAGAPANAWSRLVTGFIWNEQAIRNDPGSYVSPSKMLVLQNAALAKCDTLDGVKDGLLEDPRVCHFDPATVQCKGDDGPDCLTPKQVEAVKKIYAGPKNPRTGEQIFPGYEPGAEGVKESWPAWITGLAPNQDSGQFLFGNSFFADVVFENPKWDFRTLNFDSDVQLADRKAAAINSVNPDLSGFNKHGGKLIQYHGWGDSAISPLNSINYYTQVSKRMGGMEKTQDFYRLFMAPGMAHCAGGTGPDSFMAAPFIGGPLQQVDREHDILSALSYWVEEGGAPEKIIASKYSGKNRVMTKPLCPYPRVAHYRGTGDTKLAENFSCQDLPTKEKK